MYVFTPSIVTTILFNNQEDTMKALAKIIVICVGSVLLFSTAIAQQATQWVVPKEADALKNPLKDNATSAAEGKKLYTVYCAVCHGDRGKGDGPAGIAITPRPADHSTQKFQAQTDGAIYWKLTTGRPPMASYKTSLKDEQRWQLVDYIRELGKAPVKKK